MSSLFACAHQDHVGSFYAASCGDIPVWPALTAETRADVCVIGGGLAGLSTALELARRGYEVVLLEGSRVGWAASGRNGGQIINGYACGLDLFESAVGQADSERLWQWSLEAMDIVRERCEQHAIDCDLHFGYVHAANKPRHLDALATWMRDMDARYGYRALEWLDRPALRRRVDTGRYVGGVFDPHSGHLHPLKYTLGLARAAVAAGVRLYENSAATRVDSSGERIVIHTAAGQVSAERAVFACNALVGGLEPSLKHKIMPVGTYVIATAPLGEARARTLLPGNDAVCDSNFVLDYYRLSADQRLLFGGKVSYSGHPPRDLAGSMRADMLKVFPGLADVGIDYAWGGFCDITLNRAPHFGRLHGGRAFFMQGFSGHGVALTGLAGRVVAEAIDGDDQRLKVFERLPHRDFPGGSLLRAPALVAAMSYFRLRDLMP